MLAKEMVRLDLPHILTPLPGPRATQVIERDIQVLSPSYTRCYPLVAARGEGAMIEDVDGNRFLDFNAGIAVASTGHCHPKVVEAIERQSKRLIHMSGTDFYYENMVQLAEKLASHRARRRSASRVLRQLGRGGHRSRDEAGSLSHRPRQVHRLHGSIPWPDAGRAFAHRQQGGPAQRLWAAGAGRVSRALSRSLSPARWHDGRGVRGRAASRFIEDELFRTIVPAEEVAGIVVEPIQGEGGYLIPPKAFLARTAASGRPPRHPADLRRSPMRHGTDRQDVGGRAFWRRARHLHHRQRHRQRTAVERHDCARGDDGLAARRACVHFWRESGGGGRRRWRPSNCWKAN